MFVSPECLPFNLTAQIETAVSDWSASPPIGFTRPVVGSCGDFISGEMDARALRRQDADDANFNNEAESEAFR
jgi:hypothetical protein